MQLFRNIASKLKREYLLLPKVFMILVILNRRSKGINLLSHFRTTYQTQNESKIKSPVCCTDGNIPRTTLC